MAELTPQTLSGLQNFPIQSPPPGVTPNFVDPDSIAFQVYITAGVCIPLMILFSLARFVSKIHLHRKVFLWNEIIFFTGLILCLGFIAMTIACVAGGAFGRNSWDVLLGAFTESQLVLALLVEILGPAAICFVKVSVLLLYLQIFGVLKWMRIASIIGIVVITAFHLSMSVSFAAMCAPSTGASQFDFLAAFVSDACTRTRILVVLQGVGNVSIDLFLLILPLPAIWRLHMPLQKKLGISAMFLVGLCACVSSIIGLIFRVRYYTAGQNNIRLVVPLWATAMAEEAAGVIICCMPITAAGFKSVKGPMLSWLSSASERALRITTSSSRSRPGIPLAGSNYSLQEQKKVAANDSIRNLFNNHPTPHDRRTAWMDSDVNTYSLQQLNIDNAGNRKKLEMEILQTV